MQNVFLTTVWALLILTFGCKNEPALPPLPRNLAPSPFVGAWVSADSDATHTFSLSIVQREDTLRGVYCVQAEDGGRTDCPEPGNSTWSFVAPNPFGDSFDAAFHSQSGSAGRLHLHFAEGHLFWSVLEEPAGESAAWKATVFNPK